MLNFKSAVLLMCLLSTLVVSAAVPDGAWNRKPWDKKALDAGVNNGDKDALAEWAYCSYNTYQNVRHNEALVFQRAKQASEKGSPLGNMLLSNFYFQGVFVKLDVKRGVALLTKAKSQGHPIAQWKFDVFQRHGMYGIKKDSAKAEEKMQRALDAGVREARWSLALLYSSGQIGRIDLEESAKHYAIGVEKEQLLEAAVEVFHKSKLIVNSPWVSHFSEDLIMKSEKALRHYASLGHPLARKYIGSYESQYGNPHLGIPTLMELENEYQGKSSVIRGHAGLERLIHLMEVRSPKPHWKYSYCSAECAVLYAAATSAYEYGRRDAHLEKLFAEGCMTMFFNKKITKEEEVLAINILRKLHLKHQDAHYFHHQIGLYFLIKNRNVEEHREYVDRGMAHLIYHKDCHKALFDIGEISATSKSSNARNLPRGVAALNRLLAFKGGPFYEKAKKLLKEVEPKMTPEQKKEAKLLIEEGFPSADKFREKAFKELQKFGDIPADWKFKKIEDEEEEASILKKDLFTHVVSLPVSIFTEAESELIGKYLAQKPLNAQELKDLTGLFLSDEVKLNSLLVEHRAGEFANKVAQMLKILGKEHEISIEDTPLKAEFGWYLSYSNKKVNSVPILIAVDATSPVIKSGLRVGDTILKCQGHDMQSTRSRNLFMRLMAFWPTDYPIDLLVRRNPNIQYAASNAHKYRDKEISVSFK